MKKTYDIERQWVYRTAYDRRFNKNKKPRNTLKPLYNKAFAWVKNKKMKVISGLLRNVLKAYKITVSGLLQLTDECIFLAIPTRLWRKSWREPWENNTFTVLPRAANRAPPILAGMISGSFANSKNNLENQCFALPAPCQEQ